MKRNETIHTSAKSLQNENNSNNKESLCTKPFDHEYARAIDRDEACSEYES